MHHFTEKTFPVLTATLFLMLSVCAFAYQNEPYDFRGIKWGTRIDKLRGMVLSVDGGDLKAYTRQREKLMLGDAKLHSIQYVFYKDQFYCVRIEFVGTSNFSEIRDEFIRTYERPEGRQYYDRNFYWAGSTASITLDYDESADVGEIGFKYMPIDSQIAEDEKNRTVDAAGGEPARKAETSVP